MKQTTVKATFGITGTTFEPDVFTHMLNLKPSITFTKGEKGKYANILNNSYWSIDTGDIVSNEIDIQLHNIHEQLKKKTDILNELSRKYTVDFSLFITIKVENDTFPEMTLRTWVIKFANDIGAEIEFDVYYYS